MTLNSLLLEKSLKIYDASVDNNAPPTMVNIADARRAARQPSEEPGSVKIDTMNSEHQSKKTVISQKSDLTQAQLRALCPEEPTLVTRALLNTLRLPRGWFGVTIDRKAYSAIIKKDKMTEKTIAHLRALNPNGTYNPIGTSGRPENVALPELPE
jgi:hypothetical protein